VDWLLLLLLEQAARLKAIAAAAERAKNFFNTVRFFILISSKFDFEWQMTGRHATAAGEAGQ
jgi:hypothetical protein